MLLELFIRGTDFIWLIWKLSLYQYKSLRKSLQLPCSFGLPSFVLVQKRNVSSMNWLLHFKNVSLRHRSFEGVVYPFIWKKEYDIIRNIEHRERKMQLNNHSFSPLGKSLKHMLILFKQCSVYMHASALF